MFVSANSHSSPPPPPTARTKKLYWATCDIRHCLDNIAPPRVFELCKKLLKETDYIVRKYSVLHAYDSEKRVVTNHVKEVRDFWSVGLGGWGEEEGRATDLQKMDGS